VGVGGERCLTKATNAPTLKTDHESHHDNARADWDYVAFTEQKNGVLIKAKRTFDSDDTLTPAEAKIVLRGEAQLKRGDSKSWRAVKNALSR